MITFSYKLQATFNEINVLKQKKLFYRCLSRVSQNNDKLTKHAMCKNVRYSNANLAMIMINYFSNYI